MTIERCLVVGLGNPLMGDDGIGPAVIASLQDEALPDWVDLLDAGSPGLALLDLWQGYRRVVLVDSARMGLEAGCLRWLSVDDFECFPEQRVEAHGGVAGALKLALELGRLPDDLQLLAVEPESVAHGLALTASAQRGVEGAVLEILRCFEAEP